MCIKATSRVEKCCLFQLVNHAEAERHTAQHQKGAKSFMKSIYIFMIIILQQGLGMHSFWFQKNPFSAKLSFVSLIEQLFEQLYWTIMRGIGVEQ